MGYDFFERWMVILLLHLVFAFIAIPSARADTCLWEDNGCTYIATGEPGGEASLYMDCGDGPVYQGSGTWGEGASCDLHLVN